MNNLPAQLARAEAIKQDMAELLRQLEARVTKKIVTKPGYWRHHPAAWNDQNPPQST